MDAFERFVSAFDVTPAAWALLERDLRDDDLTRFLGAQGKGTGERLAPSAPGAIWPLVSHHAFNRSSLFGTGSLSEVGDRALALLLVHDGIVVSDPAIEVISAARRDRAEGLAALQEMTSRLAVIEPLVKAQCIRFEEFRPDLASEDRREVLRAFGVEPDMKVFVNFADALAGVLDIAPVADAEFIAQARELGGLFGVDTPSFGSPESAAAFVRRLGQSILHLSWQIAVQARTNTSDLVLLDETEERLFGNLLDSTHLNRGMLRSRAKTQHLRRASLGGVPHLDARDLSFADAIAIRGDDSFEQFRDALHSALDDLGAASDSGQDSPESILRFERQMRAEALSLREGVDSTPLSRRVREGISVSAVGLVTGGIAATATPVIGAAVGAAGALGTLVAQWVHARTHHPGREVAVRYATIMGGRSVSDHRGRVSRGRG